MFNRQFILAAVALVFALIAGIIGFIGLWPRASLHIKCPQITFIWCGAMQMKKEMSISECREYRPSSRGVEGTREYPVGRQKSEGGSLPVSRHNSRPPTRSGSRPSTADSLRHSIGGSMLCSFTIWNHKMWNQWIFFFFLHTENNTSFDPFKILWLFIRCL